MNGDIDPRRFEVSGFADTKPLVGNDSPSNRSRNRRVEIVIRQGVSEEISAEDKEFIQNEGQDLLRDFDIEPEYLFNLLPEEIF